MAIDFTLTPEQKVIRLGARDFAQTVLAPIVQAVDEEPDPLRAFQMMKPAYVEASKRGMAWAMLPKEYGGGGLSNVDYIIAAEEIQSVDPGFGTTLLVNGLGLMPIWYYGSEEQKTQRVSRRDRLEARRTSTPPPEAEQASQSRRLSTVTTMP
jgi:alkylation response protein AidB-like acyl-CoA dehydrogenase